MSQDQERLMTRQEVDEEYETRQRAVRLGFDADFELIVSAREAAYEEVDTWYELTMDELGYE
jgi:hypothetical protein